MKIIAICGSPRAGNTEFVLKRILTQAEKSGASVELVLLRNKRIEFCNGCLTCDSTGLCNIRDDMQMIYSKLESADLIIFGSPNYFHNVSGTLKNFIDRMHPFYKDLKLKNKKIVGVIVGSSGKIEAIKKSIDCIKVVADLLEMSFVGDFYLIAKNPQDTEKNPENIQKIDEFTESLIS